MLCALMGFIILFFLPESPRFLVSKRRYNQARVVFNQIAKWNGKGDNVASNVIFNEELDLAK